METAKRIVTKEKMDRKLTGQLTSTSFMNINDNIGCNKRSVLFDTHNVLDTKIGKYTALTSKLTTQNKNQAKPIKAKIIKKIMKRTRQEQLV